MYSRAELLKAGRSDSDIRRAIHQGSLLRVAPGWFATRRAHPGAVRAMSAGFRLTCLNAVPLYGLWTPERDDERTLHVYRPRCGRDHPAWATAHAPQVRAWPEPNAVASARLSLAHLMRCQQAETAAILLESAMHERCVSPFDVEVLLEAAPVRVRERIGTLSTASESGSETRVVRWLRHAGFTVEQQVYVEGVGYVDAYAGGVFIEVDGRQHHSSPAAFEADRQRDLAMRRLGLQLVRVSYPQVWHSWDST